MDSLVFGSPVKTPTKNAELESTGFGRAPPERTKNFKNKPTTSIFGGENETGTFRF